MRILPTSAIALVVLLKLWRSIVKTLTHASHKKKQWNSKNCLATCNMYIIVNAVNIDVCNIYIHMCTHVHAYKIHRLFAHWTQQTVMLLGHYLLMKFKHVLENFPSWVKLKWRHDHLRHLCLHWVSLLMFQWRWTKWWNFEIIWIRRCWHKWYEIIHQICCCGWSPRPQYYRSATIVGRYSEKKITDPSLQGGMHVMIKYFYTLFYAVQWIADTAGVWLTVKFDAQTSSGIPGNSVEEGPWYTALATQSNIPTPAGGLPPDGIGLHE